MLLPSIPRYSRVDRKESDPMYHPDQSSVARPVAVAVAVPTRSRGCLVDGCTCKDARIVSSRRAAFFSSVARRNGETADRIIAPDAAWRLPVDTTDDLTTVFD
jgi:hypothetical protein